jgi:hypothetical protein
MIFIPPLVAKSDNCIRSRFDERVFHRFGMGLGRFQSSGNLLYNLPGSWRRRLIVHARQGDDGIPNG